MSLNKTWFAFAALLAACSSVDDRTGPSEDLRAQAEEIIDNLEAAGYPSSEIELREDATVFVGGDVLVTLEASRELAGVRRVESSFYTDDEDQFRQYATTNKVSTAISTICIDGSAYTGTLSTALNNAIDNYNSQNLSFSMVRTNGSNSGCDAEITATLDNSGGGVSGFPSNGYPYSQFAIGSSVANYGVAVTTHVITHELGHCVGFRHSDYYNRSISCGGSSTNEGDGGVGAEHIPGTPTTATYDGSVMNSCFNTGSSGQWTSSDVTALQALYGGGSGSGGGSPQPSPDSCYGACGSNAGSCWCDSACSYYGDCCTDKVNYCG